MHNRLGSSIATRSPGWPSGPTPEHARGPRRRSSLSSTVRGCRPAFGGPRPGGQPAGRGAGAVVVPQEAGPLRRRASQPGRHLTPPACTPRRSGRRTSSWARIISSGEGCFPSELVNEFKLCHDQVREETFRGRAPGGRRGVRRHARGHLRVVRPHAARRRLHGPGAAPPACALEAPVVVKVQRPQVAELKVMSWLAPGLIRHVRWPRWATLGDLVELFAETIVEELRLPARSGQHARHRPRARPTGPAGLRGSPPAAEPGDEAAAVVMERLSVRRRRHSGGAGIDTEEVVRTAM